MRVAIVAECFLPETNGVTNSVLRVVEHLERRGCEALVIAPGTGPSRYSATPVERLPAMRLPFYRSLAVGLPTGRLTRVLDHFRPDVVHLAAPVILGAAGVRAARAVGAPAVAVYQTDLAGFASRYGWGVASAPIWRWMRWVHNQADLTLAPSSIAAWTVESRGIERVERWGRGVDLDRFHPNHSSPLLRKRLAPGGELLVGFVGRLAPEKQVHLLGGLQGIPGVRLVVVGDGPSADKLRQEMPEAVFVGFKAGVELAAHVASLDVFVHTGADETFCQAIQEALASGVPVVTPAAGGPLDLVRHMENGLLFSPGHPELMRHAVLELVRRPELRARMSRQARRSVQGRSWTAVGDELLEHYRSVAGLPASKRAA
ncbi:MAG: glycosyltransferase family 1 protein [Acidimicrobiales bacterium]|nr:glycosyltransferase family 1 protein [Acidimicrobiales bacterium]